ncbi:MAG TPA: DUF1848 domain-containing protein [Lachnospiraceae bacterium]|nr:DUF1848 domain-containing protein [Lachnospiraceae bacterium]
MILSVSRRTDIPDYYAKWFLNRIREGYVYVRNPMNIHQVSKINITPDVVDCIVFWTKNPEPMLNKLEQLQEYSYYFQFTLTGYGNAMEPFLPSKRERILPVFQQLSSMIGREKVIWRYDPIIITERYTEEYHLRAFREIASKLNGYCNKVIISFVDLYAKTKKNMGEFPVTDRNQNELRRFSAQLAEIAKANGLKIETCAESIDLSSCGISSGSCIDKKLIEKITGCQLKAGKDKNQRKECGCIESIDIGAYDTCQSGCKYCYANSSPETVRKNIALYDAFSPLLCSRITEKDKITERTVKSLKAGD